MIRNFVIDTLHDCTTYLRETDLSKHDYHPSANDVTLANRIIVRVEEDTDELIVDFFQYNGSTKKSMWMCVTIDRFTGYSLYSSDQDTLVEGHFFFESRDIPDPDNYIYLYPTSRDAVFILYRQLMSLNRKGIRRAQDHNDEAGSESS